MILIRKTLRDLSDQIVGLTTSCNNSLFPTEYQTYDEAWDNLYQSLAFLRNKLGEPRYVQLVDMVRQAKYHYDNGYAMGLDIGIRPPSGTPGSDHIKLGSWLMQDVEQIVKGKPPFAYPEEFYRWTTPGAA